MNPRHSITVSLVVLLIVASADYTFAQKKPNVVILATAGTIAGAASPV
jgi:hypothetical protein